MDGDLMSIETSYRKILIPMDGGENTRGAIGYAIDLARQIGAEVTALSVNDITNYAAIPGEPDLESPLYQMSQAAVRGVVEAAASQGVSAQGMVVSGIPQRDIVEVSEDHDLVVMGTVGRTGVPHLLLGSVAEKVIRHARCPVIVVRAGGAPVFRCERMLIATDGSDSSGAAITHGLRLAKAFQASVTALSVNDGRDKVVESAEGEGRTADVAVNKVVEEGRELGVTVEPVVMTGSPADVIVEMSERYDILVMGTHGRSGLALLRLGSVAEKVIRHSRCPVMVVKPGMRT